MTLYEKVCQCLYDMCDIDMVDIHNRYCKAVDNGLEVYSMEELDEHFAENTPLEIVRALADGFRYYDTAFYYDQYGDVQSISEHDLFDYPVGVAEIAEYVAEEHDPLGREDLATILEEGGDDEE